MTTDEAFDAACWGMWGGLLIFAAWISFRIASSS